MIPEKQIPTKAFVVDAPGAPFVLQDVVLDEVRDHEVLVEMKYTGLCHTVCGMIPANITSLGSSTLMRILIGYCRSKWCHARR